jgi:hypothetical protein
MGGTVLDNDFTRLRQMGALRFVTNNGENKVNILSFE